MMDSILQDLREKIKGLLADEALFTALLLIMVALASFGLGRQSAVEKQVKTDVLVTSEVGQGHIAPITKNTEKDLSSTYYVASRNGQVYHLPHCSGAKRITETNKITFKTKAEAEQAGYRPASNCKGI